jgi:signal transduction histidine kinase
MHMQTLNDALSQLTDLVDNSLLQARLYADSTLQVQPLEAAELIDAACRNVTLQARQKNVYIAVEAAPHEMSADRKLVVSALTNLLQNVVKFTRDSGRVVVRATAADERIRFEVEDECGGLAEDQPQRLFKSFVQVGTDSSGFGLGLVIVKQAAESHGGNVRVVNRPGKGCCFVMDLPRTPKQSKVSVRSPAAWPA